LRICHQEKILLDGTTQFAPYIFCIHLLMCIVHIQNIFLAEIALFSTSFSRFFSREFKITLVLATAVPKYFTLKV